MEYFISVLRGLNRIRLRKLERQRSTFRSHFEGGAASVPSHFLVPTQIENNDRASVVAKKRGNARGAKGGRKVEA